MEFVVSIGAPDMRCAVWRPATAESTAAGEHDDHVAYFANILRALNAAAAANGRRSDAFGSTAAGGGMMGDGTGGDGSTAAAAAEEHGDDRRLRMLAELATTWRVWSGHVPRPCASTAVSFILAADARNATRSGGEGLVGSSPRGKVVPLVEYVAAQPGVPLGEMCGVPDSLTKASATDAELQLCGERWQTFVRTLRDIIVSGQAPDQLGLTPPDFHTHTGSTAAVGSGGRAAALEEELDAVLLGKPLALVAEEWCASVKAHVLLPPAQRCQAAATKAKNKNSNDYEVASSSAAVPLTVLMNGAPRSLLRGGAGVSIVDGSPARSSSHRTAQLRTCLEGVFACAALHGVEALCVSFVGDYSCGAHGGGGGYSREAVTVLQLLTMPGAPTRGSLRALFLHVDEAFEAFSGPASAAPDSPSSAPPPLFSLPVFFFETEAALTRAAVVMATHRDEAQRHRGADTAGPGGCTPPLPVTGIVWWCHSSPTSVVLRHFPPQPPAREADHLGRLRVSGGGDDDDDRRVLFPRTLADLASRFTTLRDADCFCSSPGGPAGVGQQLPLPLRYVVDCSVWNSAAAAATASVEYRDEEQDGGPPVVAGDTGRCRPSALVVERLAADGVVLQPLDAAVLRW